MTRQVDVKAIVSHIVRGDGLDKCRICMGSTKEGQVFLGDTVMMDQGKPVTLADVLEGITGTQVPLEEDLPKGLCSTCFQSALIAANFRLLCRQANTKWNMLIESIQSLPEYTDLQKNVLFAFISNNEMTVINDYPESAHKKTIIKKLGAQHSQALKTKYTCSECCKTFQYPQQFYDHLKESPDLKRACYICGEVMQMNELLIHLTKVHSVQAIECKACPALFSTQDQYDNHTAKFHTQRFICIDCGLTFQTANAHHAHMSKHTQKSCPQCDKQFRNQKCYLHHFKHCKEHKIRQNSLLKTQRVGVRGSIHRKCICNHCGKTFASKKVISAHIQIVHMKNTHRPCVFCGKLLAKAHMTEHVKTHAFNHTFECEQCGMVFKTRLGYIQHLRLHSGERPYACSHCGETFSASSRRSEHIRRIHKTDLVLKHACNFCPAKFRLPYRLRNHISTMHPDMCDVPAMKYNCPECNERFSTCRGLVHHSKKHQNVSLRKRQKRDTSFNVLNLNSVQSNQMYNEELCPNGVCAACTNLAISAFEFRVLVKNSQNLWINCFNSINLLESEKCSKSLYVIFNDNLSLHSTKTYNGDMKDFVKDFMNQPKSFYEKQDKKQRVSRNGPNCSCSDCGKEFHSPYYLNLHLKNSSQKEACWLCATICGRGEKMQKHMANVHKIEMLLCKECPLLLKTDADLERHMKKCHTGNVYTCADCGNVFNRQASLELHAQMHVVRMCRVCGAQYSNRGCYRFHRSKCEPDAKPDLKSLPRNKRSNVRDPATFICDYCQKTYPTRPQLQNHIVWIHMDRRPHQCQWCGKRFYTAARLAEHSVVHTRERKFSCDICGAKLVSKMAVVYHRRRHTGEKPYECEDCGEKFISSSRRSDHAKRKHDKGIKLECSFCKSTFVRNHDLQKHIKKVHWLDDNLKNENEIVID